MTVFVSLVDNSPLCYWLQRNVMKGGIYDMCYERVYVLSVRPSVTLVSNF